MKKSFLAVAAAALAMSATACFAHATLEQREVTQKQTTKLTIRIGHGCEGASTLRVRVQVPEGVISVKPMPKAGWKLETVVGPYDKPYQYFENTLTEGVKEVVWEGELPDAHYDEFVIRGMVTDTVEAGKKLYIPIVQECAEASEAWIEIPAEGQSADDLEKPAPGVMILPAVTN